MRIFYKTPTKRLKKRPASPLNPPKTSNWEQSVLPLGNGTIGLSAYGDIRKEKIVLNCKSLWTGGPSKKRPNYAGGNILEKDENGKTRYDYFKEIRTLFQEDKSEEAGKLCDKLVGIEDGYGAYQCFGVLRVHLKNGLQTAADYERSLDLDTGVLDIQIPFQKDAIEKRTYFVSHPDKVAVLHYEKPHNALHLDFSFASGRNYDKITVTKDSMTISGALEDNGLLYCAQFGFETDGTITPTENGIELKHASVFNVYLAMDTDYMDNYPVYRTGESVEALAARLKETVEAAKAKGFMALLEAHKADFSSLMRTASVSLGGGMDDVPTDVLLKAYKKGKTDRRHKRTLEELLYAYGRYLTVASSRSGDLLPSNLQGIWNCTDKPIWASDFHLNINLQMNYWPTYMTNLAPCADPLLRYVDALRVPGRLSAEAYTGIASKDGEENGFLFHTQNTPFGWTCPGWDFSWGWSPVAVAWILHNVYEYYEYTKDEALLQNKIYPMLLESARYFEALLVEKDGRLLSVPCFSPEHGPRTMGNTYEQSLLWQLFHDTLEAEEALGVDTELIAHHKAILEKLSPLEIGSSGQIKEWYHEAELGKIGEKHHRHLSHLLGLYPGNLFDKFEHPEYIKAAKVSLNGRGDKSTGWAMGQRICTWARIGDGNRALSLIETLFQNGIYVNLFDFHPPFQIDGNFGYTAGVTEMLMQSHLGCIEILPALPTEWAKGEAHGLVARGNFVLDFSWNDDTLETLSVTSRSGGICRIRTNSGKLALDGTAPQYDERGCLVFETEKGKTYALHLTD